MDNFIISRQNLTDAGKSPTSRRMLMSFILAPFCIPRNFLHTGEGVPGDTENYSMVTPRSIVKTRHFRIFVLLAKRAKLCKRRYSHARTKALPHHIYAKIAIMSEYFHASPRTMRRFMRVHRSHIIAIDRVASLRRAGENGVAELAAPVRCTIPVARSHFRQVKQLVEARLA